MIVKFSSKLLLLSLVFLFSVLSQSSFAELYNTKHNKKHEKSPPIADNSSPERTTKNTSAVPAPKLSDITFLHMKNVASFCISNWESESCIKELSSVSMDMATSYAEALDAGNQKRSMESLKQHCAASTAALKISVPAYAMRSALTECINTVSDINDATSIKPNINLYQILVGSVLCLSKDASCKNIELQLSSFK